jgi:hypothetical protein
MEQRKLPLPGDKVRIGPEARRTELRGKVGTLKAYVNAIVLVDGQEVNLVPNNFELFESADLPSAEEMQEIDNQLIDTSFGSNLRVEDRTG